MVRPVGKFEIPQVLYKGPDGSESWLGTREAWLQVAAHLERSGLRQIAESIRVRVNKVRYRLAPGLLIPLVFVEAELIKLDRYVRRVNDAGA